MKDRDDQVSINIFDLIDSICADFRDQWRAGKRPEIEDYLQRVPEQAQANLFKNLLLVEIRYRQRIKERPSSDDYTTRFPHFRGLIGDAFYQSTSMSIDALPKTHDADSNELTEIIDGPAAESIGDYELIRELGRGAFGVVFEGRHTKRQNQVALKTLPTGNNGQEINAERLHKFRREFRALSETNHPNLVGMQTLEVDGDQWFFTMDLLHGTDFRSYVRPDNVANEDRLRAASKQLVAGILALHKRGIVHRDLKPGNVMVDARGHLTILDFGLVAELQPATGDAASLRSAMFAGTPRYAAPEQLFGERSEASDWYALGTMLFEALTGEAPFDGTHFEVMRKKQQHDAPKLSGRQSTAADLAKLADDLLNRDTKQRPTSAAIAAAVGLGPDSATNDSVRTTSSDYRQDSKASDSVNEERILVGREHQLADLNMAKQELTERIEPVVVFISGLSGEGKSSLADAFLRPIREGSDMLVLSGRCYDRESVPFKAIDSIIEPLVDYLRSSRGRWLETKLPGDIAYLAHLFPVLMRVDSIAARGPATLSHTEPEKIRARGFYALRELLRTISICTPLVVLIDDLQWADSDSAQAWCDILTGSERPLVLFLGSFRSDEADNSSFLQTWKRVASQGHRDIQSRQVQVEPLSREQCIDLAAFRTGADFELIQTHVDELIEDTGGNPYLLEQLIEGFDPSTGIFHRVPLDRIIAERLERLPDAASGLLDVIAVSGQPILVEEASEIARVSASDQGMVTHMRSERLVRLIGHREKAIVDTYHDKIRETTLKRIDPIERKRLHSRLGEQIEDREQVSANTLLEMLEVDDSGLRVPARVLDLVYHFDNADDERKAFVYAFLAGEGAKKRYALDLAIECFGLARRRAKRASRNLRYRLSITFAESLVLRGQFKKAIEILDETKPLAESELHQARIDAIKAEIAYKSGSITESIELYEQALVRLGIHVPKSNFGYVASFGWHEFKHAARKVMPKSCSHAKKRETDESNLKFRVINGINYPLHFRNSPEHLWVLSLARYKAVKDGSPTRTILADGLHGGAISTHLGWYPWARNHLLPAVESARNIGDVSLEALCLRLLGYAQLAVGNFQESTGNLEQSAELFQSKVPDYWQRLLSRLWLCAAYYRSGRMVESASIASEAFSAAISAEQNRVAQMAIDTWARATGGGLPFPKLKSLIRPAEDDFTTTIQLLLAECHWHRFNGRTAEAIRTAEDAVGILRSNWILNLWTAPAIRMLATTLREHAEQVTELDPTQLASFRSRSLRVARWAVRVTRFLKIEYPASLRELSLTLEATGRIRQAQTYAGKSLRIAKRQGASYEHAQSLLIAGQLGARLGRSDAREQIADAESQLAVFDVQIDNARKLSIDSN